MRSLIIAGLCLVALPAIAQEPKPPSPDNPMLKNLILALQQISVATEIYVSDTNQRLAAKDARVKEWEAYFKAYIGEPQILGAK